jgi:hypothetical protein
MTADQQSWRTQVNQTKVELMRTATHPNIGKEVNERFIAELERLVNRHLEQIK